ncbi:MAG: tRNA 2-thiouridine(34) synthase MnmA [Polyangiaceae bacterium]|nr:tRNA 2-thiouridine(34) synthase MnmA [Polyangiaceae bacterium]MCW5789511.1 tRNA 2-thiouridine(34) synthase MnmA [Polyangiaceae bacterium]
MSGGVDSSVVAARLVAEGYDVVGVTLHLWDYPDDGQVKGRCCAPEDVHDARRVADDLGIPHFAFDRRELFEREVVSPFVESYLSGETPSPCVRCNRGVKVQELLTLAARLGASRVATGHYARVQVEAGRSRLYRARDLTKDQSYFLHMLSAEALARLMFPLGNDDKQTVRAEAHALGLRGAGKGESQELCFVPRGRYDALVSARAAGRLTKGPVVDDAGRVLAEHDGIHRFTVGQRRGVTTGGGRRLYVVRVDPSGVVELGERGALMADGARLGDVSLADDVRFEALRHQRVALECEAVVRYRGAPVRARLERRGEAYELWFQAPIQAVVPGQVAVLYRGDRVLGGGTIRESLRAPLGAAVAEVEADAMSTALGSEAPIEAGAREELSL